MSGRRVARLVVGDGIDQILPLDQCSFEIIKTGKACRS